MAGFPAQFYATAIKTATGANATVTTDSAGHSLIDFDEPSRDILREMLGNAIPSYKDLLTESGETSKGVFPGNVDINLAPILVPVLWQRVWPILAAVFLAGVVSGYIFRGD